MTVLVRSFFAFPFLVPTHCLTTRPTLPFLPSPTLPKMLDAWNWEQLTHPSKFKWIVGITPFSDLTIVFGGMIAYLVVIFSLQVQCACFVCLHICVIYFHLLFVYYTFIILIIVVMDEKQKTVRRPHSYQNPQRYSLCVVFGNVCWHGGPSI
jgi:hypothetical protein